MNAGGRQSDHHIAWLYIFRVEHLILVHNAYAEACKVILVHRIKSRHLGSFAANQRTAGLYAAVCHALNDVCYLFRDIFAQCNIIQEYQRFCTAADDVVDTHCHTVDAHCVMLVQHECNLQLGAHAVCSGNQNRLGNAGQVQLKGSAEAADAAHHARCHGSCNVCLHQFNCLVSGGNVYAGCLIAFAETFAHIVKILSVVALF